MSRLRASIRRANTPTRPEGAVRLRVAALIAVMLAVAATGTTGAASPGDVIAALLVLPIGAYVSYRMRRSPRLWLKALLAIAAVVALWRFFGQLAGAATLEDTRIPLADLFIAVQVIHGFDMPQRRDIGFGLVASLALLALGGVEARSVVFAVLLLAYLASLWAACVLMQRSAARERAEGRVETGVMGTGTLLEPAAVEASEPEAAGAAHRWRGASNRRTAGLAGAGACLLVVGASLFLFMPRGDGVRLGGLPFEGLGGSETSSARVENPGLPHGGSERPDGSPAFNPDSYFGFAELVDLRTRGELSDDLVMRVRTDRPRLWRGMVFDRYEDSSWRRTAEEPEPIFGIPVDLRSPQRDVVRGQSVVQTFELESSTPNLVFAAAQPSSVYHAAGSVMHWDDGTITTGALQEPGEVYSVVSRVLDLGQDELRWAGEEHADEIPDEVAETYLQLPAELPRRVRDLAAEITADADGLYAKAEAVEDWLGANTEYTLDLTPQPPGTDAVDWFLFEQRRGWCEPIATSMVVLLRAEGVPARLATGFAPGPRNPLTGWYEARMSDAHAWVEVFVPQVGWVTMDPTARVPAAVETGASAPRIAAIDLWNWLGERQVGPRLLATGRTALPWAVPLLLLVAVAAGAAVVRHRRAQVPPTPFERATALLEREGIPREPWQTPREYVATVRERRENVPPDALERLLADEEARLYADGTHIQEGQREDEAVAELERALR